MARYQGKRRKVAQAGKSDLPPTQITPPRTEMDDNSISVGRTTIEADLNDETLSKCDPQDQSFFFFKLPLELRIEVYEWVFAQYEDQRQPYPDTSYYYRPGYTAKACIDTRLLLTCRRVWLEGNAIPMRSATHTFWFFRGPPHATIGILPFHQYFNRLTPLNLQNLHHVQIFAQSFWLETVDFAQLCGSRTFCPKILTVSVRARDWDVRDLESETPLGFKNDWLQRLLNAPFMTNLWELRIELETEKEKYEQLYALAEGLSRRESWIVNYWQLAPFTEGIHEDWWTCPNWLDVTDSCNDSLLCVLTIGWRSKEVTDLAKLLKGPHGIDEDEGGEQTYSSIGEYCTDEENEDEHEESWPPKRRSSRRAGRRVQNRRRVMEELDRARKQRREPRSAKGAEWVAKNSLMKFAC
ncbi:hypothetical protein LTR50_005321 [Elasticomyces elasticus]|nr:hypothetical protein LTR50_005321 [Elasticomyces elasticus]